MTTRLCCTAIVFWAGSALSGCGSSQVTTPGATSLAAAQAERGSYLYVATGSNVSVLSYPGGRLVRSLGITGHNLCSDKTGDVFIPTTAYQIAEYSHDGTLIQELSDLDTPLGCAVDPTTGDLAVTNEASGAGEVAIFPGAQQPAQYFRDPEVFTYGLCTYDNQGNLFVDGAGSTDVLAELPRGSNTFKNYTLSAKFAAFGDVQWDGRYVTLSDPTAHALYRIELSQRLKVVGTTRVDRWHTAYYGHWPYVQTWIDRDTFIAQTSARARLGLWRYPKGGAPSSITKPFESGNVTISGITISVAP